MDIEILKRIEEITQESWWSEGLDALPEIINEFEEVKAESGSLNDLIEVSMSGPGFTDVWLPHNLLISDVLGGREPLDKIPTPEEIYDDNIEFFAAIRKELLAQCQLEVYGESL
jgi:hypothetical protein